MKDEIFALGELGGEVRLVLTGRKKDAFAAKLPSEVVCLLHTMPSGRYRILPDGSDVVPISPTIEEYRVYVWNHVKNVRAGKYAGPCWTPKGQVSLSVKDPMLLYVATNRSTDITMLDNEKVWHELSDLSAALDCISSYTNNIHQYSVSLRAKIDELSTQKELDELDVENNWPANNTDPRSAQGE